MNRASIIKISLYNRVSTSAARKRVCEDIPDVILSNRRRTFRRAGETRRFTLRFLFDSTRERSTRFVLTVSLLWSLTLLSPRLNRGCKSISRTPMRTCRRVHGLRLFPNFPPSFPQLPDFDGGRFPDGPCLFRKVKISKLLCSLPGVPALCRYTRRARQVRGGASVHTANKIDLGSSDAR